MMTQEEINLLQLFIFLDYELMEQIKKQPEPSYRIDIIKDGEIIKKYKLI